MPIWCLSGYTGYTVLNHQESFTQMVPHWLQVSYQSSDHSIAGAPHPTFTVDMICLPHKVELVASPGMKPNTSACKFGPDVDETKTQHLMIFCRLHSSREVLSKYLNKTDLLKGRMNLILFGWMVNGWYEGWILVKMDGFGSPSCKLPLCLSWKSLLQNT